MALYSASFYTLKLRLYLLFIGSISAQKKTINAKEYILVM